jgi:hypothetical protein
MAGIESESALELAREFFGSDNVRVTPQRVEAECPRDQRPTISFDPSDPESVARAKNVARGHNLTVVTRICQKCNIPCGLRRLDDDNEARLLRTFRK